MFIGAIALNQVELRADTLIPPLRSELEALDQEPTGVLLQRFGLLEALIRRQAELVITEGVELPPELWSALKNQAAQSNGAAQEQELAHSAKLQKALQSRYSDRVEPFFLDNRHRLERVAYSAIKLSNVGIAEELYLRLIDQEASFEELALAYSEGDEKHSGGRLPLMPIQQAHPQIQSAITRLSPGEVHPPLQVGEWFLLIRLDHRQPAELDERMSQQLRHELFNAELQEVIASVSAALLQGEEVAA